MESVKIMLGALWNFVAVTMLVTMTLTFIAMEEIQMTGEYLAANAIWLLIPLVMAALSVITKDKINRWANLLVGIIFTFLNIVSLVEVGSMDLSIFAYGLLMEASVFMATVLIVWYAWKWPKREETKLIL